MSDPKHMLTAAGIVEALRERFKAPEYALLEQVRSRTGYSGAIRTADAMAFSLYPSRGLELHGLEIKVSRGDWLRELKNPAKAEEIAKFCDRWWIVVGDGKIVAPGELPPSWGLLVPGPKGALRMAVEASKLEPTPLSRAFVAAVLRNVAESRSGYVPKVEIAAELAKARAEGVERAKREAEQEVERYRHALEALRAKVAVFEERAGIQIDRHDVEAIGDAVAAVRAGKLEIQRSNLAQVLERVRRAVAALEPLVGDIDPAAARKAVDDLGLRWEERRALDGGPS